MKSFVSETSESLDGGLLTAGKPGLLAQFGPALAFVVSGMLILVMLAALYQFQRTEEQARTTLATLVRMMSTAHKLKLNAVVVAQRHESFVIELVQRHGEKGFSESYFRNGLIAAADQFRLQLSDLRKDELTAKEKSQLETVGVNFDALVEMHDELLKRFLDAKAGSTFGRSVRQASSRGIALNASISLGLDDMIFSFEERARDAQLRTAASANEFRWAVFGVAAAIILILAALIHLLNRTARRTSWIISQLNSQATIDPLTGAYNRRALDLALMREIDRAERNATPLSLAIIDLDNFKAYNDSFGHVEGDVLLQTATQNWKQVLKKTDLVARTGGEEFVFLFPGAKLDDVVPLLDRVRSQVPRGQTCSAGVTAFAVGDTIDSLLRRADTALYRAKANGKNRLELA